MWAWLTRVWAWMNWEPTYYHDPSPRTTFSPLTTITICAWQDGQPVHKG